MSLEPILAAPWPVQVHVLAALLALIMGPIQLILPKGTTRHRIWGWTFVISMIVICVSAFLIFDHPVPPRIGPLSWLHLVAVFTLFMIWRAIAAIRRGDVQRHRRAMAGLVYGALLFPAVFAFAVPGRIMYRVVFGH
jgi:uncharacterized membrane protein